MGDEKNRKKHFTQLKHELHEHLSRFLAVNESKKSPSMADDIKKLNVKIEKLSSENYHNNAVIELLIRQLDEYRKSSEREKEILRRQIEILGQRGPCRPVDQPSKCSVM